MDSRGAPLPSWIAGAVSVHSSDSGPQRDTDGPHSYEEALQGEGA
jgi:hypothetical protein